MKTDNNKRKFFPLGPGWLLYFPLLLFSLAFTQMLRSPASSVLFGFVLILPIVSFLHGLIGRSSIQVYVMVDKSTAEKMIPVSYEIRVINSSFLPYPFVTACIMLPDDVGVKCSESFMKIPLVPFGSCFIKESVAFRYRGSYGIGVGELYISDLFRLFTFRVRENVFSTVTVYPRKLELEKAPSYSVTDIPSDTAAAIFGADRSEQNGIREYVPGDSLKSIHWKLSSKTQDLQVREFTTNDSRHVWIFCDLAGRRDNNVSLDDEKESAAAEPESEAAAQKTVRAVNSSGVKAAESVMKAVRAFFDKLFHAVSGFFKGFSGKNKRRRMIKRGVSERDADTIALIDQLIMSNPKKSRKKHSAKNADSDNNTPQENTSSNTDSADGGIPSSGVSEVSLLSDYELEARIDELEGVNGLGADSPLCEKFVADMDEYCADGVVEIAVASVIKELMGGGRCTLIWRDPREDTGIALYDIESSGDLERIYHRFSTAPCIPSEYDISSLASLVDETGGSTVRVVTANMDAFSEAAYEKMPSAYGGAGTGNVTEILLFNPEERYENRAARRGYIEMCRESLASSGVNMTEVRRFMYSDGVLRLISVE